MLYMIQVDNRQVLVSEWDGVEGQVVNGNYIVELDWALSSIRHLTNRGTTATPWYRFSHISITRIPSMLWGCDYNSVFEWFERGGGRPEEIDRIYAAAEGNLDADIFNLTQPNP